MFYDEMSSTRSEMYMRKMRCSTLFMVTVHQGVYKVIDVLEGKCLRKGLNSG